MCRAMADGGRRCSSHADVARSKSGARAKWALRASKVDAAHPADLTPRFDADDEALPTIAESRRAVQLSPRLRAQLVALMPGLLIQEQRRTAVQNKLFEAEAALELAHTSGTPGDLDKAAIELGRVELVDQASARRLEAWTLSHGFLSLESMHNSLRVVASPKGVPALR